MTNRREQLEAMLRDDPHDSFLRYALAMEHRAANNPTAALAELRQLLAHDTAYLPAYQQAGQLLIQMGDHAAAKAMLSEGVRLAGQLGNGHAAEEMQGLLAGLDG